jgi:hypothetical protein
MSEIRKTILQYAIFQNEFVHHLLNRSRDTDAGVRAQLYKRLLGDKELFKILSAENIFEFSKVGLQERYRKLISESPEFKLHLKPYCLEQY